MLFGAFGCDIKGKDGTKVAGGGGPGMQRTQNCPLRLLEEEPGCDPVRTPLCVLLVLPALR